MKIFFLLLVFVLLVSCSAVKSRPQKRQEQKEVGHKYDARFLRELEKLSKERLPKYDTRRKLSLLFDKYQLSHADRRHLIFFDGLPDLGDFDLADIITSIIGNLLGDEDEGGKNKAADSDDSEDEGINVPPGSTVKIVTTTTITSEGSEATPTVAAAAAAPAGGKKQKGGGKRVRERRL